MRSKASIVIQVSRVSNAAENFRIHPMLQFRDPLHECGDGRMPMEITGNIIPHEIKGRISCLGSATVVRSRGYPLSATSMITGRFTRSNHIFRVLVFKTISLKYTIE